MFGLSMGLSLKNISIFLLMIGWVFAVKAQSSLYNRNTINVYMVLLGFFIITSNIVEVLSYDNFSNIKQYRVLMSQFVELKNFINPWIFFVLLVHIIQTKKECKNAMVGIMILLLLTAATGVIDQFTSINLGTQKQHIAYEGRSAGFAEANQYGAFLVLILPITMSYMLLTKEFKSKLPYAAVFIIGIIGLISTVSRGAFIGFIIATIFFFIISIKLDLIRFTRMFVLLISLVPVIGIITYSALPSSVKEAFTYKVIEKADTSKHNINPYRKENKSFLEVYTSGRTEKWAESLAGFSESPIWGRGNYTVKKVLELQPHNDYLKILVKYGIIGFILYIMLYLRIFRKLYSCIKNATEYESKIIYLGFFAGFIGYMVCMFGVGLGIPRYIFWIYVATVIRYSQYDFANEKQEDVELQV
jgi:O-antigen ligase